MKDRDFTLRNIPDVLTMIPFLVGHHPMDSVVVVVLECGSVTLTARIDLEAFDSVAEARRFAQVLLRDRESPTFLVAVYSPDGSASWQAISLLRRFLPTRCLQFAVHVDGHCWQDQPNGTINILDVTDNSCACQAVYLGMTALASREEVIAAIKGPAPEQHQDLRTLGDLEGDILAIVGDDAWETMTEDIVQRFLTGREPLTDKDAVRLSVLLTKPTCRDCVWQALTPETADSFLLMAKWLLARTPTERSVEVLGLLAIAAWLDGQGVLTTEACERMNKIDGAHALTRLVTGLVAEAVSPKAWLQVRHECGYDADAA